MPKPDLLLDNHMLDPERERQYLGECDGCGGEIFRGDRFLRDAYWECVVHDDNECIRLLLEKQGFTEGG